MYESDLAAVYAANGETVVIGTSTTTGTGTSTGTTTSTGTYRVFYDGGYMEALGVAGTGPSLRCIASTVSAVNVGHTVVRSGVTFKVRNKLPIGPDELETRLVLEKQ